MCSEGSGRKARERIEHFLRAANGKGRNDAQPRSHCRANSGSAAGHHRRIDLTVKSSLPSHTCADQAGILTRPKPRQA